tara:strand:- start:394 stop:831 length:438 start_codon:yes stop_codon:yes gene_type:complete
MSASTKDLLALSESILAETPPVKEVVTKSEVVDDGLKAVVVSDAFVKQVVGFNGALNESSDPDKKQEMMPEFEPITEATVLKERLETLVENLKALLKEAKNVMQEMTTCGMIGVGAAKALPRGDDTYPPVKKDGSRKRNKGNKGK